MATIREISDRAGVSIATVSKVLNNKSGAKQETADRILLIADQLNYRPNLNPRSLKLGDADMRCWQLCVIRRRPLIGLVQRLPRW